MCQLTPPLWVKSSKNLSLVCLRRLSIVPDKTIIQDFLRYLEARQKLFVTKHIIAESESDILAQHLWGVMKGNSHILQEICKTHTDIYLEGGLFEELKCSPEYAEWHNKIKKSYFWDELLQKTFFYIENGLSLTTTSPTIQEQSELFKRMAREDRFHRYALSEGFLSFLAKINPDQRGTRILFNPDEPEVCYILFLLPRKEYMSDDGYRKVRKEMLMDYCSIVKAEYPEVLHIIGVAHESSEGQYTSEDFIYLDAREWSKEQQAEALKLKQEYEMHGCLAKRTMISRTFYPDNFKMKGRDRNKPSPCGSGKKFKNCCGK